MGKRDMMLFAGGSGQDLPTAATFKVDPNEMTAAEKDQVLVGRRRRTHHTLSSPSSPRLFPPAQLVKCTLFFFFLPSSSSSFFPHDLTQRNPCPAFNTSKNVPPRQQRRCGMEKEVRNGDPPHGKSIASGGLSATRRSANTYVRWCAASSSCWRTSNGFERLPWITRVRRDGKGTLHGT